MSIAPRFRPVSFFPFLLAVGALATAPAAPVGSNLGATDAFERAAANGRLASEGFERCHRYLHAWLREAEPTTGLIPRNLTDSPYWNGRDSAADNYPFMVLSAHFTDRAAFDGPMKRMLENERKLTVRPGWLRLSNEYNLRPPLGLRHPEADATRILFNSAEYVKDGLLALTEWLGPSPWSERMFELVDDSFALAATETPFGKVPLAGIDKQTGVEVSGDYLQALARMYWMSGRDEKYLRWGARLADLYLLPEGRHHPTRDFTILRLRDHGCEIVSGLCEFYATVALAGRLPGGEGWAAKQAQYRPHVHEMLDRILAIGRNEHGMLYNEVNPQTGEITDSRVSDSWGYVFDGFYTVHLIDGVAAYREAALDPLGVLDQHYRHFNWEPRSDPSMPNGSQDGYADSIESALNLANRAPADPRARSAFTWIDREIHEMWSRQQPDGLIERWHGDGNFARTTIMFCLWKTQGLSVQPWRADVRVGAVREGGKLFVSVSADRPWRGRVLFDRPRHAENLNLPIDWPRINQFPEWTVVKASSEYVVRSVRDGTTHTYSSQMLRAGLPVELGANTEVRLEVTGF
jgi:hypothetical protein